jgi:hypothetical protein
MDLSAAGTFFGGRVGANCTGTDIHLYLRIEENASLLD